MTSEIATIDVALRLVKGDMTKQVSRLFPNGSISQVKGMANEYNQLVDTFGKGSDMAIQHKFRMEKLGRQIGLTNREMRKLVLTQKGFNFDFLTFIFGGMMLKNTFGGALKSIITDYNRLTDKQTEFGQSTLGLQANFNFLKFAIGNALNQPFVIDAIESMSDALQDLGDWASNNPNLAGALIGIMVALAGVGYVSLIAGNTMQIGMMGEALDRLFAKDFAGKGKGLIGFLTSLKGVGAITTTIATVFTIDNFNDVLEQSETLSTKFNQLKDNMLDLVNTAIQPLDVKLIKLGDSKAYIAGLTQKFAEGVLLLATGLIGLADVVGTFLIDDLRVLISLFIDGINTAKQFYNAISGEEVDMSKVGLIETGDAANQLRDNLRDNLDQYGELINKQKEGLTTFEDVNVMVEEYHKATVKTNEELTKQGDSFIKNQTSHKEMMSSMISDLDNYENKLDIIQKKTSSIFSDSTDFYSIIN